jgi:hypothetical protein
MREISEDRDRELLERVRPAYQEMHKASDVGAFLLSSEAYERIMQYQDERAEAWKEHIKHWSEDCSLQAAKECLNDFIEIAKKDLGHKHRWSIGLPIWGKDT